MAVRPLKVVADVDETPAIRGLKKLGDEFEDVADEAEDSADDIAKAYKKAGDKIETSISGGLKDAGKEAHSSGKEAAASFSGGFDDIVGFLQETAANAFEGFGPAGAAGGLLVAAGIGIASALFDKAEEKRKALEEKANDLAQAYIEAGTTVLDEMAVASRSSDILTSDDPAVKQDLKELTDALGDRSLALRVLAGDTTAMAAANDILKGKQDALDEEGFVAGSGKRKTAISEEAIEVGNLSRILGEQSGVQADAIQKQKEHSDLLVDLIGNAKSATREVDKFGNVLYTLPSGTQVVIDADTGQATTDVKQFKGDVDKIPDEHVTNVKAKVSLDTTAIARYRPPVIKIPGEVYIVPGGRYIT